jgi:hypothetical protein
MKIIYISGAISWIDIEQAHDAFQQAELDIISAGHEPVNPLRGQPQGLTWLEYMVRDIQLMADCNAIYMLRGWEHSAGAKIEHALAIRAGFEILYQV